MEIPDRVVTQQELRRNTGERGTRMFVACDGIVYDVTDCPRWKSGLHQGLHFPGQDLTAELGESPHKARVFNHPCVIVVGKLEA